MKELIGTGVALITPFTTNFEVDVEALKRIVNYQIDNGIDYLVVLGTTGESVTLSEKEKQLVIDTIIEVNERRLPLVLGIGGNNTKEVVNEITTRDLSAFSAVLSVSPAYNKPTQEGIYQHFSAIAKVAPKPVILYNVPGRTASNMLPETVIRLANDFPNIVAIKEAAGDMVQAMRMISGTPDDFLVISGDDMIALPMTLAGGAGVISVIGEGFPKEFAKMIRFGLERKVEEAYEIHYKIAPCTDHIFAEGNPAGIKAVFSKLGLCGDTVRLPLVGVGDALRREIDTFVASF
ncbi:MAG: 4-hydroxy-tetrahydrodipicolinate synthase [Bacteroidetes bacterium]|nr:4-hydroxy-tetrahydrodipicolinate synthase [Bacteroidota bacterium]TDI73605.1 MAG: 4-hydroxy-tetrahydrodipicolinate synthase [Bacteroidota bacterium]